MAYVAKTRLEEVAAAIQELRWHEMRGLAKYIASITIDGSETPDDWAAVLHDWSADLMNDHQRRCDEARK